jgi:hypothetical protein
VLLWSPSTFSTRPVFAHGFGQCYDLPIPLWLYLYGAGSAVLLSFFLIGYFVGKDDAPHRCPRFDLLWVGGFGRRAPRKTCPHSAT